MRLICRIKFEKDVGYDLPNELILGINKLITEKGLNLVTTETERKILIVDTRRNWLWV